MKRAGRLFARGIFLQALYNPVGQQRGGLAWILGKDAGIQVTEPFNANPTLAGYAIGLACASEGEEYARYRGTLTAASSALGDRLVWGLLRLLAVIASLIASAAGAIPAAAVLLLVYNPPELTLRWRSTKRGLRGMRAIAVDLAPDGLPKLASRLGRAAALILGCLAGFWLAGPIRSGRNLEALAGGVGVLLAVFLLRRRGDRLGIVAGAGSVLFAIVWLVLERIGIR